MITLFAHTSSPSPKEEKTGGRCRTPLEGPPVPLLLTGEPCSMIGAVLLAPDSVALTLVLVGILHPRFHSFACFPRDATVGPTDTHFTVSSGEAVLYDRPVSQLCQNKVIEPHFLLKLLSACSSFSCQHRVAPVVLLLLDVIWALHQRTVILSILPFEQKL